MSFELKAKMVSDEETYGKYKVGHIAVASDDLKPRDGVFVADDVDDVGGPVLLHPGDVVAARQ